MFTGRAQTWVQTDSNLGTNGLKLGYKPTQTWVQTDSNLGTNGLKLSYEPTQTWVRIDCIWVRNDRGYVSHS